MQSVFSKALSKAVSNHNELSETRRETLTWLALLVMQQGTICLWPMATGGVCVDESANGLGTVPILSVLSLCEIGWHRGRAGSDRPAGACRQAVGVGN